MKSVIVPHPSGDRLWLGGQWYNCKAWTGGQAPVVNASVRMARRAFFRLQVNQWRSFWQLAPHRDTMRIFFKRATHDAFATLNQ